MSVFVPPTLVVRLRLAQPRPTTGAPAAQDSGLSVLRSPPPGARRGTAGRLVRLALVAVLFQRRPHLVVSQQSSHRCVILVEEVPCHQPLALRCSRRRSGALRRAHAGWLQPPVAGRGRRALISASARGVVRALGHCWIRAACASELMLILFCVLSDSIRLAVFIASPGQRRRRRRCCQPGQSCGACGRSMPHHTVPTSGV